ncbi:hypothetical protein LJC07_08110 [Christensenellaceae bacterium OttesenSCG-928-L17]|nr:hypothetical protein [Christensenellaceae bacterium OttesenSCG-928-L17]
MARRRRGKQTRRRHTINWGRFIVFLVILVALIGAVLLLAQLLNGKSPFGKGKPTPTPSPELLPESSVAPAPTSTPRLTENFTLAPAAGTEPETFGFKTGIRVGQEDIPSFSREQSIRFGSGSEYTDLAGILTFAGNNYRNTFTYGTQTLQNKTLTRVWEVPIGTLGSWSGVGWTGQPVIVKWPEATRKILGIKEEFKSKADFVEVIYATLDGYIYFIELESGKQTRDRLYLGVNTKGTASLDPRGYPLLYTGQGIESTQDGNTGAWFRIIDLIENKVVWSFGGRDPYAHRAWQAYDSSALVSAQTDTLIAPGENGILYTVKLNSSFDAAAGTVSVNPGPLQKYRYMADGYATGADDATKRWVGIENSISVFRNFAFFTDNGGRMQCLDLNTFEIQYVVDVTDDSDTSPVIEEDAANGTFYLYTANEVDKQPGVTGGFGKSYHRKIDGRTGKILWEVEWSANIGNTSSNGGTLSTPHVGREKLSDIVIYNATLVPVDIPDGAGGTKRINGARIVAYNKHTGEELWRYEQENGYWSSPVVVYNNEGDGYLIQCDRGGIMRIHDPLDGGKVLFELDMGSRMEGTPAVYGDYLVVGTRGTHGSGDTPKIIGVKIG